MSVKCLSMLFSAEFSGGLHDVRKESDISIFIVNKSRMGFCVLIEEKLQSLSNFEIIIFYVMIDKS
jgi:hypothetical protein